MNDPNMCQPNPQQEPPTVVRIRDSRTGDVETVAYTEGDWTIIVQDGTERHIHISRFEDGTWEVL